MRHRPWDIWIDTLETGLRAARRRGALDGEAEILNGLGIARVQQRDLERFLELHARALRLRRRTGDRTGEAHSTNNIGFPLLRAGHVEAALCHFDRAVRPVRDLGDRDWQRTALLNGIEACSQSGRGHDALVRAEALRALLTGWREPDQLDLMTMGEAHRAANRLSEALRPACAALSVSGDDPGNDEGFARRRLAAVRRDLGEHDRAAAEMRRAVRVEAETGDRTWHADHLVERGRWHDEAGEDDLARRCLEEAFAVLEVNGSPRREAVRRLLDPP